MRIEGNSRTLYLLDVGGSKFDVRFKARETEGLKFEVRGFEDAVQGRVKTAKMNVPVRDQTGARKSDRRKRGRIPVGLSVCRELFSRVRNYD